MKVVIIGSGNVATVLGRLISSAGYDILQVYSRRAENAVRLAEELGCTSTDQWGEIRKDANLYLVSLADNALNDMNQLGNLGDKLVVHTAGSITKDVLEKNSANYGVLYPLQSLRKENTDVSADIPFLIDGNTEEVIAGLEQFGLTLSSSVERATDEQRLKLHVAAVIVSNFTNHMYTLAADYCTHAGVNFKMLQPLIEETALRLRKHAPADMQTGPAIRKDITTLDKHLRELSVYPKLRNVYLKLSDSIMNN